MDLTYKSGLFYFNCGIADTDLPTRAGFSLDRSINKWVTPFASVAQKVSALAGSHTKQLIRSKHAIEKCKVIMSHSTSVSLEVPTPKGMELRPYQKAGVSWAINNNNLGIDSLIGDDMGLGKTPQAICACTMMKPKSVLIVCPASLKINWSREWAAWSMLKLSVGIAAGKKVPTTDVVIINYDILTTNSKIIKAREWDVLILDEVQYIKNPKALRTREIIGGRLQRKVNGELKYITKKPIIAKRKLALTGTPIPNKIIELYTTINYLLPVGFPNQFSYAKRYCAAYRDHFGRWDFNGSSNLKELQHKLRSSIMIRRLKQDVLTELPPKVRQVIELEGNSKKFLLRDTDLWSRIKHIIKIEDESDLSEVEYREVIKIMGGGVTVGFEDISTVRKETGLEILPMAITHLRDAIEASGKVVCFCWHQEVAEALGEAFKKESVTLVGSTPLHQRQKAVDAFQNDSKVTLFIGNLKAAGVGLTLTASAHVVIIEDDYVPGNMTQAEDRCHRYGQKGSVLVQYLVLAGSIAARMMKVRVKKQEVADKALDSERDDELTRLLS